MAHQPVTPKEAKERKRWPLWAKIILGSGIVFAGIFGFSLIMTVLPSRDVDYHKVDPEAAKYEQEFYGQMKDVHFFKDKVNPKMYQGLVEKKIIPPEWAEGNYVPYYDPSKRDQTTGALASVTTSSDESPVAASPGWQDWGRQLILEGTLDLQVANVRTAFEQVQAAAAAEGAIITDASLQAGGARTSGSDRATLVLRIPQSRFPHLRQTISNLAGPLGGKILKDQVSSQDVTEEYVDLQSRLRNEQAQEAQLLEIMRGARKISDILAVRNQLASVQEEIERLQGRLRYLANRVDLSTLTVNIVAKGKKPVVATATIATAWRDLGKNLAAAWSKSLQNSIALIGLLVMAVFYLWPFALLLAIIWLLVRLGRRRLAAKSRG